MSLVTKANKYRFIVGLVLALTLIVICRSVNIFATDANGGTGGAAGSGDGWVKSYCISSDSSLKTAQQLATCPHYILGTIDQFKTAYKNKVGSYTAAAYNFCSDSTKNTSGYVVFVGREYQSGTSKKETTSFTQLLALRNITANNGAYSSAAKWKAITAMPAACDASSESCTPNQYYQTYSKYGNGTIPYAQSNCKKSCSYKSIRDQRDEYTYKSATSNSTNHIHGNFWDQTVPNWSPSWASTYPLVPKSWYILFQETVDDLGLANDADLAFFCPGMTQGTTTTSTSATFSGSVTAGAIDGKLSGDAASGFVGNGTDTSYIVRFYYNLARTDANDPNSATSNYGYSTDNYPSSGTASVSLGKSSGSTLLTYSDASVTVSVGSSTTACGYLSYDNTVPYTNGVKGTPSFGGRAFLCVSITNPQPDVITTATFSNSISVVSPDSKLSGDSTSGFTGDGRNTNYKIRFYYHLNRTDSNDPSSASSYYAVSANDKTDNSAYYPSEAQATNYKSLGKSSGDTYVTYSDVSISVPIGGSAAACGYISYNDSVTYKNEVVTSSTFDGRGHKCVSISNPPVSDDANFSGSSSVSQWSGLTYISASRNNLVYAYYRDNLALNPERTTFTTDFSHSVKRTDNRTTPATSYTRWKAYQGYIGEESYFAGGNSAALAKESQLTQVKSDSVNVYVPLGGVKTYCEYIAFDATVYHWTDGTITRSGYNGTSDSACLTIKNPRYRTQTIVAKTDEIRVSGRTETPTVSGAKVDSPTGVYSATERTINLSFNHSLSRGNDEYNSDPVSPSYTVGERRTSWNAGSNSLSGATVTLAIPGASWTSSATNGSTTASATGLPAGRTTTICHKISSINYAVYEIPWYQDQKQAYYNDGTSESWENVGGQYRSDNGPAAAATGAGDNESCATIYRPYNFRITEITPEASSSSQSMSIPGDTFNPTFKISVDRDDGDRNYITDIDGSKLEIRVITYQVDDTSSQNDINGFYGVFTGINSASFCRYLGSRARNCTDNETGDNSQIERKGDGVYAYNGSYTESYAINKTVPTLNVGEKYCVAIALKPLSSSNNNWVLSKSFCTTIIKKPVLQVLGGSVFTAGGISTSQTINRVGSEKFYFGSWGDFALISGKETRGMASGAAYAGGAKIDGGNPCSYSPLTVANSDCANRLGVASVQRNSSDFFRAIKSNLIPEKVNGRYCSKTYGLHSGSNITSPSANNPDSFSFLSNACGGVYAENNIELYYKTESDIAGNFLKVPSSTRLRAGGSYPYLINHYNNAVIFYSPKSMEITRNMITASSGLSNVKDIPVIILIAEGDIIIDESVTELDAWVIAGGNINTCSVDGVAQTSSKLDSDTCNEPLTINGPVYAKSINFTRTYGNDWSLLGSPAEKIDFMPMITLWGYGQSKTSNSPKTVYIRELSPRY